MKKWLWVLIMTMTLGFASQVYAKDHQMHPPVGQTAEQTASLQDHAPPGYRYHKY